MNISLPHLTSTLFWNIFHSKAQANCLLVQPSDELLTLFVNDSSCVHTPGLCYICLEMQPWNNPYCPQCNLLLSKQPFRSGRSQYLKEHICMRIETAQWKRQIRSEFLCPLMPWHFAGA